MDAMIAYLEKEDTLRPKVLLLNSIKNQLKRRRYKLWKPKVTIKRKFNNSNCNDWCFYKFSQSNTIVNSIT